MGVPITAQEKNMQTFDEDLYLRASHEIENNNRQEGLWTKSLTLEKGDVDKAKYTYIQLRVEQLKGEMIESASPKQKPPKIKKSKPVDAKFTDPTGFCTNFTVACLWALALVTLVAIVSDWMQYSMLENINLISQGEADRNDTRVSYVDNFHILTIVISTLAVLFWRYKANRNCWYYGAQEMRFTPGWAVGWSFVPVMNLFKPYQVMQEIWKTSTVPNDWKNQKSSVFIKWWWFFCLVDVFIGRAFSRLAIKSALKEETVKQMQDVTVASIMSSITTFIACLLTLALVLKIQKKQKALVQQKLR